MQRLRLGVVGALVAMTIIAVLVGVQGCANSRSSGQSSGQSSTDTATTDQYEAQAKARMAASLPTMTPKQQHDAAARIRKSGGHLTLAAQPLAASVPKCWTYNTYNECAFLANCKKEAVEENSNLKDAKEYAKEYCDSLAKNFRETIADQTKPDHSPCSTADSTNCAAGQEPTPPPEMYTNTVEGLRCETGDKNNPIFLHEGSRLERLSSNNDAWFVELESDNGNGIGKGDNCFLSAAVARYALKSADDQGN
jgi:hypothetical protein